MSYPLAGVNFVDQLFTPTSDCALWRRCVSDGVLDGLDLSTAGSSLSVAAGWLMCGGKELQLPAALTIPVTGAVSGYARLLATVDLSGTSSYDPYTGVTTFTQAYLELEYNASLDGFASLTQEDLAGSGTKYQLVLCVMSLGAAGITGIVSTCGHAHGRAAGVVVDLPAASWSNGVQTVRVDGVHADTQVIASENPDYSDEFDAADIRLFGQAEGTITLRCKGAVPSALVKINVLLT